MLEHLINELTPQNVQLVAVSKTKPKEAILECYEKGQRIFGENYIQELVQKHDNLPKDIVWHFIGHLQTNKVKMIAPFVCLIHSVDSFRLLVEINKRAIKHNRTIDCLLQFHIATEASKFGLDLDTARTFLQSEAFENLKNINLCGVMGMATFTSDKMQVKQEFQTLKKIFDTLKNDFFAEKTDFKEISMGMSGDYKMAVEEGSTMVRVGSLIFGKRVYK